MAKSVSRLASWCGPKYNTATMNRSRLPIVVLLLVSLLAAGLTRHWASVHRQSGVGAATRGSATGLSRMNSFALALLLGGLRGPLVMFLWPSAETQKQEKNLEDFDTKIEWIRLLQAEFDTVHIFQIWNKAYNISVQMANLGNKYRTILDALDYAHRVDAERPGNINTLTAIGQVYFDKLGNSAEKAYYRERVREESQARKPMVRVTLPEARRQEFTNLALAAGVPARRISFSVPDDADRVTTVIPRTVADSLQSRFSGEGITYVDRPRPQNNQNQPGWRRSEMDQLLDAEGRILKEYLVPRYSRPADLPADAEFLDGSELQFLPQYEPFPYGVSPLALAYNYYKRAQLLQKQYHQKHAQLSDIVVDSRPALSLKGWAEEEWERALRAELEAFGKPTSTERVEMQAPTADLPLDAAVSARSLIDEAIFSYHRGARLTDDAIAEYERHLDYDKTNITIYLSHIDDMRAHGAMMRGDGDFLKAMTDPAGRAALASSAAEHYRKAQRLYRIMLLQYYTPEEIAIRILPEGVNRGNIAEKNLSDEQLAGLIQRLDAAIPQDPAMYQSSEEYQEYRSYLERIDSRLKTLSSP